MLGHAAGVPLTHQERLFVDHRRSRKHIGLYVLPLILLTIVGVWIGMFMLWPVAVNPKALMGATAMGTIKCEDGSLSTYAAAASILTNVVFLLLAATVVLRISWSSSERRYLRLIEKLEKDAPPVSAPTPLPAAVRQ
jgi:small-conductance mechanosensitive channel